MIGRDPIIFDAVQDRVFVTKPITFLDAVALPSQAIAGSLSVLGIASFGTTSQLNTQVSRFEYNWTNAISTAGTVTANLFRSTLTATDLGATDGYINLLMSNAFGNGGVPAIGTMQSLSNVSIISGSGNANNEIMGGLWTVRTDIGTGYTQAIGPTTQVEVLELNYFGPIAVQPQRAHTLVVCVNNYYNGSPAVGKMTGIGIETATANADANDALHLAATTYAVDYGLLITGTSTGGNTGFTTAIQVGGSGTNWNPSGTSKVGTGLHIRDHATAAIVIDNPSGTPYALTTTAGKVGFGTATPDAAPAGLEILTAADPFVGLGTSANYALWLHKLTFANGTATGIAFGDGANTVNAAILGTRVSAGVGDLMFYTSPVGASPIFRVMIMGAGRVGIGVQAPTAQLHLMAGAAAASSGPLKFTSGTHLTTAEAGCMEYNGTNLFFTRTGTVREGVLTQSAVTTEVVVTDTTVTVNIGGTTYKLLARA